MSAEEADAALSTVSGTTTSGLLYSRVPLELVKRLARYFECLHEYFIPRDPKGPKNPREAPRETDAAGKKRMLADGGAELVTFMYNHGIEPKGRYLLWSNPPLKFFEFKTCTATFKEMVDAMVKKVIADNDATLERLLARKDIGDREKEFMKKMSKKKNDEVREDGKAVTAAGYSRFPELTKGSR